MKQFKITLAVFLCLVSIFSVQVNAQLVIRNSGHAEIGQDPNSAFNDSITTLRIFGDGQDASRGRITFGDSVKVAVGELGETNTDRLWLHGKNGAYLTCALSGTGTDTIAYFDPSRSAEFNFAGDLRAHGVFIDSDERYKDNIEPVENVLSTLLTLNPVTYKLKSHRQAATAANKRYAQSMERGSGRYGFLAQNVKDAFPELVHTDNAGYMSVDYIGLIPILVQSINELQARIDELEQQKDADGTPLLAAAQAGQSEMEAAQTRARLYQNAPNPWSSETVIRYCLPQGVAQASIYIYDMQGTQIKSIAANGRGESQVTLTARDLKAGMYLYALVADGTLIESKTMILTK